MTRLAGGNATEQGKAWAHVANMSHEMAAPTMTGAMNDVLEQREGSIEEYRKGISLDGAGTGAAFGK